MVLQGTVISYNPSTKVAKQGGGTYDAWELVYKNLNNEVKSLAKPVQGLRFNVPLKNALAELKPGDEFTVVQEKNANGYLDPKSVVKGIKEVQDDVEQPMRADAKQPEARGGKVTGSNYETPEERAKKQVVIVRQGVLNAAIAFAKDKDVTSDGILDFAKEFEKYVYKDLTKFAKEVY
jgi:hypothetical protein